jgi:wyosine [tRNA(Phe)-imidazoG37] synthetase (radical SAM superfamily)
MPKSTVYGPIASWRLGRSLGVDMLCTEEKTCNFDCIYCQLGANANKQSERKEFVGLSKIEDDLKVAKGVEADWVTFSGMGEPTLASNLGDAIAMAKSILGLPVAVFTNGGLIKREDVRKELAVADMVILKLDASEETLFRNINRPAEGISLPNIIQGYQAFRMEYSGKIALDIMLNELNIGDAYHLRYMARFPLPDQIQLNAPIRPCSIKPLPVKEFESFRRTWFSDHNNVITVHEAKRPVVVPIDEGEAEQRHPTKPKTIPAMV